MTRSFRYPLATLVLLAAACAESPSLPDAAGPVTVDGQAAVNACTADEAQIVALLTQAFSSDGSNLNSALSKWDQVVKFAGKKNPNDKSIAKAQDKAYDLIDFLLDRNRHRALALSQADLATLINQILCFVGIDGGVTLPDDTWIVHVGDPLVTFVTKDGLSGIQFPANAVSQNTLVKAVQASPNLLNTLLDKYPFVYDWSLTPSQTLTPGTNAVVGVCPSAASLATVPAADLDALLARLVLGHQGSNGFTPLARVPIPAAMALQCGSATGALRMASRTSRLLNTLASVLLPTEAHAATARAAIGGVGGSTSEFSPFGPVDPLLKSTGGVGGSTSEFIRTNPGPAVGSFASLFATIDGTVGTQRTGAGLPSVTITTYQGTPFPGVNVAWTAGAAATSTPVGNASVCGATTSTDQNGSAAMSCLDFGTTVQYRVAYTKLTATMSLPAALAGGTDGNPVVTVDPGFQNWLVASYGPSTLVFTDPPAGRTEAAGNPYHPSDAVPARVEIRSDLGQVVPIATNSVTLLINYDQLGAGNTRTANAVGGVAMFGVTLIPERGYRFGATATLSDIGLVSAAPSNLFDVLP